MLQNAGLFLALLILAAPLSACSTPTNATYSVETLQSQLNRDLPAGSDAATVEKYLGDKGFEHSGTLDGASTATGGTDAKNLEIRSIVRDVKNSQFVTTSLTMVFKFDSDRKLQTIAVAESHTGP